MFTVKCKSLEDYQEVRRAAIEVGYTSLDTDFDAAYRSVISPRLKFNDGTFVFLSARNRGVLSTETNFNWDKESAYVLAYLEEEKTPEIVEAYKDENRGRLYSPLVQEKAHDLGERLNALAEIQDKLQEYIDQGLSVKEFSFRNEPDGKIITIKMQ